MAEALAFAHEHGVIHRDIKPSNVVVTGKRGHIKLTDFGIAHLANSEHTLTGQMLGSPRYMSPEQAMGREIDGRSDIFSLGALLYEMITGQYAFDGDSLPTILYRVINEAPVDAASLRSKLPAELSSLLARMLDKNPEVRPDANALVNALRGVLLTFNCVDSLREHLRQDVRIHGIVTKGGAVVNVVPELAQAEFACRALDTATMENAYAKIVNCAKAAELGTGATLEFKEPRVALKATITDPALLETVQANLKTLGIAGNQLKNFDELASSDLGMVSYNYPTVNLWFKIAPEGTALHSDAMREAANTDDAWKSTLIAGKAVALSAYDMLTNPAKLKAVQDGFKEAKAKEGK